MQMAARRTRRAGKLICAISRRGNGGSARSGIGLTYDDRDTIFSIVYENTRDTGSTIANDWSIGARLSFRTLGDINVGDTTLDGFDDY